jgi:hypothetical protein
MNFAKIVFRVAGFYGLPLVALFFTEGFIGRKFPPAVNHPEFYYGFAGLVVLFHVLYLIMSFDIARYRPLMLLGAAEKFLFGIPTIVLFLQNRVPFPIVVAAVIDLAFGVLFLAAYRYTAQSAPVPTRVVTPTAPA